MSTPGVTNPNRDQLTFGCEMEFFVPALVVDQLDKYGSNGPTAEQLKSLDPMKDKDDREIQLIDGVIRKDVPKPSEEWDNQTNTKKVSKEIRVGTKEAKEEREKGWKAAIKSVVEALGQAPELKPCEYQHHTHDLTTRGEDGLPKIFHNTVVSREETAETLPCDPTYTSDHRYRRAPWGPWKYIWYAIELGTIVRTQDELKRMEDDVKVICNAITSNLRVAMDNGRDQSRLAIHAHVGRTGNAKPSEKFSLTELKKLLTIVWLVEEDMIKLYAQWRSSDYIRYNSLLRKHTNLAVHCDAVPRPEARVVPKNTNIPPFNILNSPPGAYNCAKPRSRSEEYLDKEEKRAKDDWLGDLLSDLKGAKESDRRAIDMIWGAKSVDELTWLSASSNKGKRGAVAFHALLDYDVKAEMIDMQKEVTDGKKKGKDKLMDEFVKEFMKESMEEPMEELRSGNEGNVELANKLKVNGELTKKEKGYIEEHFGEYFEKYLETRAKERIGARKGVAIVRNVALGTIEFRYMHGSLDAKDINDHIEVCKRLCEIATSSKTTLQEELPLASTFIKRLNTNPPTRDSPTQGFHNLLETGVKNATPQKEINDKFDEVQDNGKRRHIMETPREEWKDWMDTVKVGTPLEWHKFLFVRKPGSA